jgi:PhoPQ-activated pathogenicity-related protein
MMISSTPLVARNSSEYSSMGAFTRGSRTLGVVFVKGRNRGGFIKESASKRAWTTFLSFFPDEAGANDLLIVIAIKGINTQRLVHKKSG